MRPMVSKCRSALIVMILLSGLASQGILSPM